MRYALTKKIDGQTTGLFPATFENKKPVIVEGAEPIITGKNQVGGIWLEMKQAGWEWVQGGSFGPRYWENKSAA